MRIVIAGPGALGSLLAARFSSALQPGDELTLLDHRAERARLLSSNGFTLEDRGTAVHFTVNATADPSTISGCDLFFLCTRSADVTSALNRAASLLTPATLLISMQRGICHLQTVRPPPAVPAAAITSTEVFPAATDRFCCPNPGSIHIGLLKTAASHEQLLDRSVDLLNRAGLTAEKKQDIMKPLLEHFFMDLAVNALAAIYRRPNGQLLTSCSVRGNMKKLLQEAVAVCSASGLSTDSDPVKAAFHFLRTEKTGIAPMFRDIKNGRSTEIDALNGCISAMGKQVGIPTPTNDDLVMRIKKMERRQP